MTFNYANIRLEDFNENIIQKYQFPEDKDLLKRFMRGDTENLSVEQANDYVRQANKDMFWMTLSLMVGVVSYSFLQMPGGKVIRDRYDASISRPRWLLRRLVPFFSLAYPIILVRARLSLHNGYVPN